MGFLATLRFLTALPLPEGPSPDKEIGKALGYFPLVGALLGLALAGLDWGLRFYFPTMVVSALLIMALVALTGGLHLDGLADTCDGVFTIGDPARRLEIMRDSRIGAFGVAGVACILLLKFSALASLAPETRGKALVLMGPLARWAMVYGVWAFPYGRVDGLGTRFKEGATTFRLLLAGGTALVVSLGLFQIRGLGIFTASILMTWLTARFILTRIPGLTGDSYGAINELTEALVLVLLSGT